MAGMSFAWRAVTPSASSSITFWSPELMNALERSMSAAREHLAAGRIEEAIAGWEAILREVPGLPAPRRQSIRRLIRKTACACARRALQGPIPDMRAALRWLHRAIPSAEPMPPEIGSEERFGDDEQADVLQTYGLLLHLAADRSGALRYYEAATEMGGSSKPLIYAVELARLQSAWVSAEPGGGAAGAAGGIATNETWQASVAGPGAARRTIGPTEPADPLLEAAWRRLQAMIALYEGDAARALSGFPPPDTPALPRAWALEGALLSAMSADWARSLKYYRRALGSRGFSDLPSDGLHRYVFIAVAWQCIYGAASGSGPLKTGTPAEPESFDSPEQMHMVDIEEMVMAERLPQRPPPGMFANLSAYRAWTNEIRRWQHRLWVGRALHLLPAGNDGELRSSLRAMIQLRPGSPVSRWIGVWLACTGDMTGSARLLRDSYAPPGSPRHVLQLSVLAAERFGRQEYVIDRLNLLLHEYPDDQWGLSRWREWMMKLAEEATADGRYKQAFFQYVSLTLYLPDDADGWNGCARVLELLGDDARAEDCRQEAKRVERLGRKRRDRDLRGAAERPYIVERDILRALLADPDDAPTGAAGFPLADAVLRRAVWESFQTPDVYLRVLLERWAGGPTNFPKVG